MQKFPPSRLAKPADSSCVLWFQGNRSRNWGSSKLTDLSSKKNNGTILGASWQNLITGAQVLSFDGVDDYVNAGNAASLNITSAITIEAWVKPNIANGIIAIKSNGSLSNTVESYHLMVDNATPASVRFGIGNGTLEYTVSGTSAIIGAWHHLVGVYDGTYLRIYVDGIQENTNNIGAKTIFTSTGNLIIGREGTLSARHLSGTIDEVRIWNRALTALEISDNFQRTRYRYGV